MYSLVTGLWHYLFSKQEYNVLILGLDNSGKTTLLEELKRVKPPSTLHTAHEDESKLGPLGNHPPTMIGHEDKPRRQVSPTVGLNVGRFENQEAILRFWDLGGKKDLRTIWNRYFQDADALIFVFDSTDLERSGEAQHELRKLLQHADLSNIPVLIIGNKKDSLSKNISNRELAKLLGIMVVHGRERPLSPLASTWPEGVSPPPRSETSNVSIGSAIRRVNSTRQIYLSTPSVQSRSPRVAVHRSKAGETSSPIASFRQLIIPPAPPQTPRRPPLSDEIFLPCHLESRLVHIMQTSVVRRRDLNHVIRFLCLRLARLRQQKG